MKILLDLHGHDYCVNEKSSRFYPERHANITIIIENQLFNYMCIMISLLHYILSMYSDTNLNI